MNSSCRTNAELFAIIPAGSQLN